MSEMLEGYWTREYRDMQFADHIRDVCRWPEGGEVLLRWRLDDVGRLARVFVAHLTPAEYRRVAFMCSAEKVDSNGLVSVFDYHNPCVRVLPVDDYAQYDTPKRGGMYIPPVRFVPVLDKSEEGVEWFGYRIKEKVDA